MKRPRIRLTAHSRAAALQRSGMRFLSAPRLPGPRTPLKLGARVLAFHSGWASRRPNGWCLDTHFTSVFRSPSTQPPWFFMLGIMEGGNSNTKKTTGYEQINKSTGTWVRQRLHMLQLLLTFRCWSLLLTWLSVIHALTTFV